MQDSPRTAVPGQEVPQPESPTSSARRRWTLALAGLGAFLCSLDVVVVATALPTLQSRLGAQLSELEWTINAYNLAFACLMLTGSALGDRFGRRTMYIIGLGVFTAASAACALSDSADLLIVARTVQGAGAAVVLPLTLTLISEAFPVDKRGVAIGMWGGITGLGVAGGPVLGGAITEGVSWEWIFWINVPIGLVMIPLAALRLRESFGHRPDLDIPGLVLVAAGLFCLTWAPVRAPSAGWSSIEVVVALIVGALFVVAFLLRERRARHPMLPLEYFRLRGFSSANGVIFFQFLSLLGALFMITQLFQIGLGNTPLEAGLRLLVWTGMPMITAPVAGALSEKWGNRPFMIGGLLLQAAGLGWLAGVVEPGVAYTTVVPPLIVAGVGIGMIFATTATAATAAVPVYDTGVAAGTNTALREVGGVFGIAILAAVFAHNGSYASPAAFIDGVKPALWVAAVVPLVGLLAAFAAPSTSAAEAERATAITPPDTLLTGQPE
ncbi:MFS transporter [Amycolatopsis jiangsuensis]|uniref:EmrB/QacA subfamily drug resistance transporter n=1 Tax=Amycolatopsis jiangsuensis TaxID=1181879 RepID=A0A840J191_9PSEU|nr:MFS transporter [Amycolatopsis jiangsuensis]MBB4687840.1 EmrB/QacA subfamily drug resistance transporter [Amycolatopsis jiangsuensis]